MKTKQIGCMARFILTADVHDKKIHSYYIELHSYYK
jgi:hypothetical protein